MRKIIVTEFITLDGVMQGNGGPEEGFDRGGWAMPYYDEYVDKMSEEQKAKPTDFLWGRKTFEMIGSFFFEHPDIWPHFITGTKYILSKSTKISDLKNTVFIETLEDIQKLKESEGLDLNVTGSSTLVQLLLKHRLVDELWLLIHPIAIGEGKKLFADGTIPTTFRLVETSHSPSGVIFAHYTRAKETKE